MWIISFTTPGFIRPGQFGKRNHPCSALIKRTLTVPIGAVVGRSFSRHRGFTDEQFRARSAIVADEEDESVVAHSPAFQVSR